MTVRVLLSLGSNSDGERATGMARVYLDRLLTATRHSELLETEPIGMDSVPFTNSFTVGDTDLDLASLTSALKRIESLCGNSRRLRKAGIVKMDIDILLYGDTRHHEADWSRPYIRDNVESFLKEKNDDTHL